MPLPPVDAPPCPATIEIQRLPTIQLPIVVAELLRRAFCTDRTIFVEREFTSGYSGASAYLISRVGQAPVVAKVASPFDLQQEYAAFHRYVAKTLPQNSGRIESDLLVSPDGALALLTYTFAGSDARSATNSLAAYYGSHGGKATAEVLERILRIYGRQWWANNELNRLVISEEYDRLLPVHLQLTACATPVAEPVILQAGRADPITIRHLRPGQVVYLLGCQVTKVRSHALTVRVAPPPGERSAPLRFRIEGLVTSAYQPGDSLPGTYAMVTTTRLYLLADAARLAVPTFDLHQERFSWGEKSYGNPLYRLVDLLDKPYDAKLSIIHGDLNLQNILVDQATGYAWLIDFAETRRGPALFDLQRLEVQVITKLLAPALAQSALSAHLLVEVLTTLHGDPLPESAPHPALQEPYLLLRTVRRLARQYLVDDQDWDEYYRGLSIALVGALKFDELAETARLLVLIGAGATQHLLGQPLTTAPAVAASPAPRPLPKPPEPMRPPVISGFVGRARELAYFAEKLTTRRWAVIAGMAGVGKTALAAALLRQARADLATVFWHSFHEGEGIEVVFWRLAAFLAWHERPDLWHLLQQAHQTGGQPPPIEMLIDYVLQLLAGGNYLLCLDDFHFVDEDPALNQLVARLGALLPTSALTILITTRRMPEFARAADFEPLAGLDEVDAQRLLLARGVTLTAAQCSQLYAHTAGNAVFLTLAIDTLQQARSVDDLLTRLAATDDMERYLLTQVDESLSGQERMVMQAVALLLGYAGTREAIETILQNENSWRVLRRLQERYLLTVQEGETGRVYRQHAILRDFYYELTSPRQRRQMHLRASDYYATTEPKFLLAALHYERAGETTLATAKATTDVWAVINQGQARALQQLLQRLSRSTLPPAELAEVAIAQGLTEAFLGERDASLQSYQTALTYLATVPATPAILQQQARTYRGLAELWELENPEQSLAWCQRGLDLLRDTSDPEQAALYIRLGNAHMHLGNYAQSIEAHRHGLQRLPLGPTQLRALALLYLGGTYVFLGQLAEGRVYTVQALQISQQLHDDFQTVNILVSLAVNKYISGEWQAAIADWEQALTLATQLGSDQLRATVAINLGAALINLGDDAAAQRHLASSLALAQAHELHTIAVIAQFRLADLHGRLAQWDVATTYLQKAEKLALQLDDQSILIAIYRTWAESELAAARYATATAYLERSLELATTLDEALEQGETLRLFGRLYWTTDQIEAALAAWEQSLALLADKDPYEAARTQMLLGAALATTGETERGAQLVAEAQATFRRLGAQRDLL